MLLVGDKVKTKVDKHGIPEGTIGYVIKRMPDNMYFQVHRYKFISEIDDDYQGWFEEDELENIVEELDMREIRFDEWCKKCKYFDTPEEDPNTEKGESMMEERRKKMIPKEVYEGLLQAKTICIMHTADNGQCMISCPFVDISKRLNGETDCCMIKDSKPSDIKLEVKTNYYISKKETNDEKG